MSQKCLKSCMLVCPFNQEKALVGFRDCEIFANFRFQL